MEPDHFDGTIIQTDTSKGRIGGPCKCGSCSSFTHTAVCPKDYWTASYRTCCGRLCSSQPYCVPVSAGSCSIGLSSTGVDPLIRASWDKNGPPYLQCRFDGAYVDTQEQVDAFVDKFGDEAAVGRVFCLQPKTLPDGNAVSRINTVNGNWCKRWYATADKNIRDAAVLDYCARYPLAADCKCVNRAADPLYDQLKILKSFPDDCWYIPCVGQTTNQLKTSDVDGRPTGCPSAICQNIIEVLQSGSVKIDDVKSVINCDFSGISPPSPPPKPAPVPPAPTPAPTPAPEPSIPIPIIIKPNRFKSMYIVIAIIGLFIGVFMMRR